MKPRHYCPDWDELEIHPGSEEMDVCGCTFMESYMTWIPLDYVIAKLKERKFSWLANWDLKYINIRIDMRDDHCVVLDRHDKVLAESKEQLDELFKKLDQESESNPVFKRVNVYEY